MDPPTALSCILLEPFDTSLNSGRRKRHEWEQGIVGRGQAKNEIYACKHARMQHLCSNMSILTQEQGRFLPAESCALVVHSLQVSSCTAEHHGLLGFPGLEIDKTCLVAGKTAMLHILFLSNCCAYLIQPDPNQSHVPEPLFLLHMYSIYST